MRTHAINLQGSTQQERQKLYDFLASKKEPMYADTSLTKKSYDYNYFLYSTEYKNWVGAKTTDFSTLSINNFIAKFINTGDTMSTINVGDVYLNSAGKTCTILAVNGWDIKFKHQDGGTYTSGRDNIAKKWTKQTVKPIIANLQPGTKVRVRSDLRHDKDYCMSNSDGLESVTKAMVRRAGTIVTIDKLNSFGTYFIKEDNGYYNWTDDMFSEIITTTEEQPIIYKIDKSKLKPGTVIHCDTFEKAVAITSLIAHTIDTRQYSNYNSQTAICVGSTTHWTYYSISYYKSAKDYTIVPFEDILVQTACKFKVGDIVRFKPGIKPKDVVNGTTIIMVENMDTATLMVSKLGEGYQQNNVQLSNGYWYGVDALELVPQTCKQPVEKTKKVKEPVAQQEPIKSIKKEESFMSKLKATAITTIDQNKEAAIIAAKMEAGRVINKQVIKQAAKHVPFWAKGYLDTPLAPVVLANAVAMLGNHTGNAKVQKVSELMLLAAADVTVQSFNLDQIIDDILSGIKLPAGILDDVE